ncbi:MAG: beta-L-arabinofuranosidase domain-containing protein [Chitinophagaceae bacterium]
MNRLSLKILILACCLIVGYGLRAQTIHPELEPISFSNVTITDNFWKPKMDKVATATLQACIYQTEEKTARIRNFEKVARNKGEQHEGIFYDDSDVFKALEAISYSLKNKPDAGLEKKADEWIGKIAAAQLPDGYLNTYFTLHDLSKRWTDMSMHEDYNGGHMIEAAVAYYEATGKRKFLDVVINWANHFDYLFGPGKKHWVTGHQELELALVKLYKVTKEDKYLKLAHWLLEERGHGFAHGYTWTDWKDTAYAQDVKPVKDQTEITGHAVRAMYLYIGAADVAAFTGDQGYLKAMKTVWEDVVYRNMYITGGIGSSGGNEGFSKDYDLPNEQAYCETCASVGMVFWNQRMNSLTGESKYIDVLERSLYNGALDGLSLSGDRFFYGNPLASTGKNARREWFGTACCPANIARLVASLGDYVYAKSGDGIWVNLFVGSNTTIPLAKGNVPVKMETNYPWEGKVTLSFNPVKKIRYALHIRVPGWAQNEAVPGNLYSFLGTKESGISAMLNGQPATYKTEKGYIVIDREWKKGDVIELTLPMDVQRIVSNEEVKFNVNRVALQRGPLVYCVEGADNNGKAWNLVIPDNVKFTTQQLDVLTEKVISLNTEAPVLEISADGMTVNTIKKTITAIPYYVWCNRGSNPMQVWIPRKISDIKL